MESLHRTSGSRGFLRYNLPYRLCMQTSYRRGPPTVSSARRDASKGGAAPARLPGSLARWKPLRILKGFSCASFSTDDDDKALRGSQVPRISAGQAFGSSARLIGLFRSLPPRPPAAALAIRNALIRGTTNFRCVGSCCRVGLSSVCRARGTEERGEGGDEVFAIAPRGYPRPFGPRRCYCRCGRWVWILAQRR